MYCLCSQCLIKHIPLCCAPLLSKLIKHIQCIQKVFRPLHFFHMFLCCSLILKSLQFICFAFTQDRIFLHCVIATCTEVKCLNSSATTGEPPTHFEGRASLSLTLKQTLISLGQIAKLIYSVPYILMNRRKCLPRFKNAEN